MKRFCILTVFLALLLVFQIVAVCGAIENIAEKTAVDNAKYCSDRIGDKIEGTLNLLISLSNTDLFQGDEVSYREKAEALTKISKQFGYMAIRVVDKDLRVYSENARSEDAVSSDLSKRDYLQALKSTLEPQVTDAFLAGSDGKTVNFTVAVPIVKDGVFNGALFAAIYETDFTELLSENGSVLLGKKLQYMSGTEADEVGMLLDAELEDVWLFGTTAEKRMLEIMSEESAKGAFTGMHRLNAVVYSYNKVDNVHWNVVCRVSFLSAIAENSAMFIVIMLSILGTTALLCLVMCKREHFFQETPDDDREQPQ